MRGRIATVLACATVAAACAVAAPAFAAAPGTTGSAPPCTTAATVVWIPHGLGDGTAGSIYYELWFTNLSGGTCTLSGFPAVSSVAPDGRQIERRAGRAPGQKPRLVTLSAGASAKAQLRIVDAGAITRSVCRPTTAAGLRVGLPGQGGTRPVPLPFEACASHRGVLSVGPFRPTE